jgi:hypothetical protein
MEVIVHITDSLQLFEKDCPKVPKGLTVHDYRTAHEKDLMVMGHG